MGYTDLEIDFFSKRNANWTINEVMRKFFLVAYIGFLFLGVGRTMLDVFREDTFNYLNIMICALSFFGIMSYINKKSEYEENVN